MAMPTRTRRDRRCRLAGALLLAAGVAAAVGTGAGWIAYGAAEPDYEDDWAELGQAVVAVAAAAAIGVLALVAGIVVAVHRTVEPGRRFATAATVLAVAAGGVVALGWLGESTTRAGAEVLALPAAGLLLAAGGALVGRAARLVPRSVALRLVTAAAAVLGALSLLAEVRAT